MRFGISLSAFALLATPVLAQDMTTTPSQAAPVQPRQTAPDAPPVTQAPVADPNALTDKEQATLDRCMKMPAAQQAQSSKCSKVMTKAGKTDPSKQMLTNASQDPTGN